MSRARLLIVGLAVALVAVFASAAGAQDGPSVTIDPETVEAAGTQTFTVTGEGFTQPALFVLPCAYPEGGDPDALSEDDCDLTALTSVTPEDGAFEVEVEYDVPAEGMAIIAADAGQVETAVALITVGAAEEEPAEEEPAEEEPTDDEDTEGAQEDDELAETGTESTTLVVIGLTVAAAGALAVGGSRRLRRL